MNTDEADYSSCGQQGSSSGFNFRHVRTSATRLRVAFVTLHEDVGANLNLELETALMAAKQKKQLVFREKSAVWRRSVASETPGHDVCASQWKRRISNVPCVNQPPF
jgi:hypothetical protein